MDKPLLSESEKPTAVHYRILFMSWAGWVFDFYDLILYTFLLIPIGQELQLSKVQLSFVLGHHWQRQPSAALPASSPATWQKKRLNG
jgi:hypothetical protein